MNEDIPKLAYFKYSGKAVEEGVIDAKSAGEALTSFNKSIAKAITLKYPCLEEEDINVPVLIRKGSWESLIPDTIQKWLITGGGIAVATYLKTAATKLAENGFKDKTLSDVIREGAEGVIHLIRLAKHLGKSAKQQLERVAWKNNNEEVGIISERGETLWLPAWVIGLYESMPPEHLVGMMKGIEEEKILNVGVLKEGVDIKVTVDVNEKGIFFSDNEEEEILFPELKHNDPVKLEGYVTRGTETSNSIGFRYNEHILTCYPTVGSITRFKSCLFSNCTIIGHITRADKHGSITELRPKIIFEKLIPINDQDNEALLPLE